MSAPLLEVRRLAVHFQTPAGPLHALRDVSLSIAPGETFGLAGESGSGKTTLGYAILRALAGAARVTAGEIRFEGEDLLTKRPDELRRIRGRRIAMVYQDPKSALNPTMTVGRQVAEVLEIHEGARARAARGRAQELLALVNIPDPAAVSHRYPHELSGGMQQRVVIAMALAAGPSLLILDEPTTGLDVTTQARILELVADLKRRLGTAILYISHDLAVIAEISDRVGILYAGELVEVAPAARLFARPAHPYTAGLLDALPDLDGVHGLVPIEGRIPPLTRVPAACVFAPRCALREAACTEARPPLDDVGAGHVARCLRSGVMLARPLRPETTAPRAARAAAHVVPPGPTAGEPILRAEHVRKYYGGSGALATRLGLGSAPVRAVDDVSFDVREEEVLAIVGESGCGKTTLGRVVVRLLPPTSGRVRFFAPGGADEITSEAAFRRAVQVVFQHPDSSLNPMKRIGRSLARPLVRLGIARDGRRRRVRELLEAVRLDAGYAPRLPRELSGGEKQRVAIARALAMAPQFILLDEPVSALDVSTQASVIRLLMDLRRSLGASYLLISHDLSLVRHIAQRVGVMYLGRLVEVGSVDEIFQPPSHPYTRALLSAVPRPHPSARRASIRLAGSVPSAQHPPSGCRFHTRCPDKVGRICEEREPPLQQAGPTHWIACHIPLADLRRQPDPIGADAAGPPTEIRP